MKIQENDIITIEVKDEKTSHLWTKKKVSYRVIALYKYFVLCQHYRAGYLECFSYFKLSRLFKTGKGFIRGTLRD